MYLSLRFDVVLCEAGGHERDRWGTRGPNGLQRWSRDSVAELKTHAIVSCCRTLQVFLAVSRPTDDR